MNEGQRENYRRSLLEMATRLQEDDSSVVGEALRQSGGDASGNLSNTPQHLADLGTDTFEQEMNASLLQNTRQIRAEVVAALNRLERGAFGKCERCGQEIGEGRLQTVPYARYCVDCAQEAEDAGEAGFQPTLLH
jgi:RNA polymerase-binding transcription factor DksA